MERDLELIVAECLEVLERIRRMTVWPYPPGYAGDVTPAEEAVLWCRANWAGIQAEAARMVKRIDLRERGNHD